MNNLEFILKLNDQFSTALKSAGVLSDSEAQRIADNMLKVGSQADKGFNKASSSATKFGEDVKHVENGMTEFGNKVENILQRVGIYFGIYAIAGYVKEATAEAQKLNTAQAQLANTLKDSGKYTTEGFKAIIKSSSEMSEHILYSKGEVIGLQSQLRLVGNISETTMKRMVTASADMAAKFGTSLGEAGNSLAKAINNPEMMRRLGMQLKIDPAIQQHIQDLAKHGKEAQAQLELLNIVEHKVGGAAAAAFNADPLAKFHKTMENIQLRIGAVAIVLETKLAAAFNAVTDAIKDVINWMEQHKTLMIIVGSVVGVVTAAIMLQYTWIGLVAGATKVWAAVQWVLNTSMLANPITWIIAAIIALIAVIGYVIYATKGWGQQWKDVVGFIKESWASFKDYFMLAWLDVQNSFMAGIELIEKGWYYLKSLWDKDGAAAGLAKINDEQNKRADAIAKQKGVLNSDLKAAESHLKWDLSWDSSKSVSGAIGDLKKKFGFGASTPGQDSAGAGDGGNMPTAGSDTAGAINSGGQKTISINIKSFIEHFELSSVNVKEGVGELENMMKELFLRVVNSANGLSSTN
jgi:hypothetical protein